MRTETNISSTPASTSTRAAAAAGLLLGALAMGIGATGCEDIKSVVKAPEANLDRIDLLESPNANQLARWACFEWVGRSTCELAGFDKPKKENLRFSFDIVFALHNPNKTFPIPLVEMLVGLLVYPGQNSEDLGALCISFCDPDEESCTPEPDAQDACSLDDATDVKTAADIIPTKEDMIEIATDVANGTTDDNFQFRYIPKNGDTEAHIQFDLNIDVMLVVMERMITDAAEDLLSGRNLNVKVPYESEGSVFFNVPEMGRYAVGYGPYEDTWNL